MAWLEEHLSAARGARLLREQIRRAVESVTVTWRRSALPSLVTVYEYLMICPDFV